MGEIVFQSVSLVGWLRLHTEIELVHSVSSVVETYTPPCGPDPAKLSGR